ncbi:MAG TPA: class I adenylate-forming enzyme family protein [Allosphingosinicella sp.]
MIYDNILKWAEQTPERPAVTKGGRDLSYGAFAQAIEAARRDFAGRGLTGEGVVVLAIGEIAWSWVCSLALRSLGLTTIAIRSAASVGELPLPNVRCVVTMPSEDWPGLPQRCAEAGYSLLSLMPGQGAAGTADAPRLRDGGHILTTSGTTGTSKMVLYDAAAEAGAMRWLSKFDGDTMYHIFDFGAWTAAAFLGPSAVWQAGGGVIVSGGTEVHEALRHPGGTDAIMLPHLLSRILAAPEGSFPCNEKLCLYLSGGTVTMTQLEEAKRRITPTVINRLASTEVGGIASTLLESPEDHKWHRLVPERGVEIVDDDDAPVPVGQVGQMRIPTFDGPSGYYNDPDATRRFFRHGYFYSGDLAVAREDGRIALQGRVTEVLNVQGSKIPPAPIEEQIREEFGFSAVCLFSTQDDQGEEQVFAVVESEKAPVHPIQLRIGGRVEEVELKVCHMPAMPRTSTGKVIREEVRRQALARFEPELVGASAAG